MRSRRERGRQAPGIDSTALRAFGSSPSAEALLLARMTEFRVAMCACADGACASQVNRAMDQWSNEMLTRSAGYHRDAEPQWKAQMKTVAAELRACRARRAPTRSTVEADALDTPSPRDVPHTALDAYRVSGETSIVPDDDVKRAMASAHHNRSIVSFKLRFDEQGTITAVDPLRSSGYVRYDMKIAAELWRWRPFLLDGAPAKVCTAITFIYDQLPPRPRGG